MNHDFLIETLRKKGLFVIIRDQRTKKIEIQITILFPIYF